MSYVIACKPMGLTQEDIIGFEIQGYADDIVIIILGKFEKKFHIIW